MSEDISAQLSRTIVVSVQDATLFFGRRVSASPKVLSNLELLDLLRSKGWQERAFESGRGGEGRRGIEPFNVETGAPLVWYTRKLGEMPFKEYLLCLLGEIPNLKLVHHLQCKSYYKCLAVLPGVQPNQVAQFYKACMRRIARGIHPNTAEEAEAWPQAVPKQLLVTDDGLAPEAASAPGKAVVVPTARRRRKRSSAAATPAHAQAKAAASASASAPMPDTLIIDSDSCADRDVTDSSCDSGSDDDVDSVPEVLLPELPPLPGDEQEQKPDEPERVSSVEPPVPDRSVEPVLVPEGSVEPVPVPASHCDLAQAPVPNQDQPDLDSISPVRQTEGHKKICKELIPLIFTVLCEPAWEAADNRAVIREACARALAATSSMYLPALEVARSRMSH